MERERAKSPRAVLFACSLNAVRSVFAAGILAHLARGKIRVASAGVRVGAVDPLAVKVMAEIGIDVSRHKPRAIRDLENPEFDLIVSLSPEAHHQALELTRTLPVDVEYWPTFDATIHRADATEEQVLAHYRLVREHLFRRIKQRFAPEGGVSV